MTVAAPRFGRLALRCWFIATSLFVLSVIVGIVASAVGPGDDSVQTWAPLIFPLVISLVSVPLLIASVVLAIRSLGAEQAKARGLVALLLSLVCLVPSVIVAIVAIEASL